MSGVQCAYLYQKILTIAPGTVPLCTGKVVRFPFGVREGAWSTTTGRSTNGTWQGPNPAAAWFCSVCVYCIMLGRLPYENPDAPTLSTRNAHAHVKPRVAGYSNYLTGPSTSKSPPPTLSLSLSIAVPGVMSLMTSLILITVAHSACLTGHLKSPPRKAKFFPLWSVTLFSLRSKTSCNCSTKQEQNKSVVRGGRWLQTCLLSMAASLHHQAMKYHRGQQALKK